MKKRILSCLMALALCLTLLPATALAADAEPHTTHCLCGADHSSEIKTHQKADTTTFATAKGLSTYQSSSTPDLMVDDGSADGAKVGGDNDVTGWLLPEGAYYLKGEVTIDRPIVIRKNVTICLNGKTLQSTAENQPVFWIMGGELTLTNCNGTGKVIHNSSRSGSGTGVKVELGGKFNLYGGTITNNTADYGGGVLVGSGTTFNMYGGSITNNTADGDEGYGGGGVCVKGGTFNMHGGTIAANKATIYTGKGNGGGVSVVDGGRFTMNGGTIGGTSATRDYNQATGNGGGVYVSGERSTFTMNGSASVAYNKAISGTGSYTSDGGNGGGVYVKGTGVSVSNNGTFTMNKNASVTGNTAKNGGGVYVKSGKFEMNDNASVSSNTASGNTADQGNGGGVYVKSGTFEMNYSASVTGNTATNTGSTTNTTYGGVYVSGTKSTFEMNGTASITDNTATNGGVCASGGTFAMNGSSKVMNNTGNGVYVIGGKFTVSGAPTVTGNKRNNADSNVFLTGSAYITIGEFGLTDGASIGVTKTVDNGVIAKGVNEDYSGKFSSDDKMREVKYENKQLVLKKKATQPSEHTHSYNENTWGKNATHHWHECTASDCTDKTGSIKDKAEHVYENNTDTTCNVCGYVRTVTTDPILVTKITLSPASPKLKVGQTQAMTVVIEPQTATKKDVTWKSSKPEVATVANDGTVTAHKAGTAEITATAEDDSKVSATCKVTVTDDTTTGGGTTPSQPGGSTGGNTGGSSSGGGGGSSSGGSGSSDSNPVIKTETKNNPDGSTTKTETRRDGSVTATTTGKDGSVSKTETKPDGSSVTENKAADGSTGTVKTDKNGQTEAKTALSNKAIEDAKKNGEAVKAPVEVEASRNSNTAPTVKVELPKGAGETKVEIPVSNVKPGTVAVLVHPDGTEEILKDSIPTEDGI